MLNKHSIKEKLLKGGAWAFLGKMLTALSGLAISALLARLLEPEEMSAYFLTFSLVSAAAIVAQLGLTQAIVRLVAESIGTGRPGRARQSVVLVLRVVAFSGLVIASLLAFGFGQWISEQLFKSVLMSQVMGLAAVWTILITFQSLMAEIYRGFHDIRLATIFGGLTTSLISMGLFLGLWLLQGQSNLDQIVLLTLGAGLSSALLSSVFLWNNLKALPSEESNVALSEMLKISWPLWITNITLFALLQVDLWIMGIFRPAEEVAIYAVASRTVALVGIPLLVVNAVVPPLIAEMYVKGKTKELEAVLRSAATLAGLPSLIVLGVFVFFGDSILGLLFGEYYQVGGIVLAVLSVGQLANVMSGSCGQVLMLTGHQFTMMTVSISSSFLMVALAWFLVDDYGSVGVASAAAIGMQIQNILMVFFAKRNVGIWTHAKLKPSIVQGGS